MEHWITSHLTEIVTGITVIAGNIAAFVRLLVNSQNQARRLSIVEIAMGEHIADHSAHRNPDFEKRLETLSGMLEEIRRDVKKLLQEDVGK